ncbi:MULTISPECIES: tyrosine-type recombinase/integrase [unclassified Campylobacter]|uniref:tyrosine-type recombinase/integrase n=1 Tax=unclassified Campylobacter TaxID=2593542 RepID=UPI0022E9DF25|nr:MULTISPECIES: site-specific integrase [unclassified Campylobacter]MDA3048205.1 tyrosine-type recombinase/integrase [Campylobacter sp. JMF_08 NE1]MDA3054995.1 tyrosine-type recombinase/integrase [Campylobacter sp. VBCF_07 NA4]MDA3060497.1 tyrosine-type recombinase/integrase [Campylobacter sp. VBCF_02 NA5]MDA3070237.1 tyrosine-type recombinase/integrase [Campylobacter sp. VBCF_08 NA3]WBR54670.1 tyrosine-type recombinase/integrase [Campylobacter sp. VBCF_01 NA2]
MPRKAEAYLTDKMIRELQPSDKAYYKKVGEPSQLYIRINPNGEKRFFLWCVESGKKKQLKLGKYEKGLYGVEQARKEARDKLAKLISGKTIIELKTNNYDKYTYEKYLEKFLNVKRAKNISKDTIKRIENRHKRWVTPSLGNIDIREIEKHPMMLKQITDKMNEEGIGDNKNRLCRELNAIFDIGILERVISYNPAYKLQEQYAKQKETHYAALIEESDIKEFLSDLKAWKPNNTFHCKHAIYLQMLCANRPKNTAQAKWADIDLENGIWTIPGEEMKTDIDEHIVALSSYAIKILKKQKLLSGNFEYVFPSINEKGELTHITTNGLRIAIINLGGKRKWFKRTTSHGFRSTFDTICELNSAELITMGLPYQAPEVALSHKEKNQIKNAYVRKRAQIEHLKKLMQWYGDYLNSIEPLGI